MQKELSIQILSWNCAGDAPPEPGWDIASVMKELSEYEGADPADKTMDAFIDADLYIVGLQEFVKLNTKECYRFKDIKRTALWQEVLLKNLNDNAKEGVNYVPIIQKVMVGTYIAMFAKE